MKYVTWKNKQAHQMQMITAQLIITDTKSKIHVAPIYLIFVDENAGG